MSDLSNSLTYDACSVFNQLEGYLIIIRITIFIVLKYLSCLKNSPHTFVRPITSLFYSKCKIIDFVFNNFFYMIYLWFKYEIIMFSYINIDLYSRIEIILAYLNIFILKYTATILYSIVYKWYIF